MNQLSFMIWSQSCQIWKIKRQEFYIKMKRELPLWAQMAVFKPK